MTTTPFDQGSQAFMDDRSTSDCHFAPGSTLHREWIAGWSGRQATERAHRAKAMAELFVRTSPSDTALIKLTQLVRTVAIIER